MKNALKAFFFQIRFSLSAMNSIVFIGFYRWFFTPKPGSIDEILNAYSKRIGKEFTVIQIGANDGISFDPIHKFIKRDGWKGVLLEPQSYVFNRWLKKIYSKNKGVHTVQAAIGPEDGTATMYKIGFSKARWASGLTSMDKSTVESAFSSGHAFRRAKKEGVIVPDEPHKRIVTEEVEMISPDSLMKRYEVNRFDLLMVDAEGFDYEVVKIFDIPKHKPGMVAFEDSHLSKETIQEAHNMFRSNGYAVYQDAANTIALREEFADLLPKT